MNLQENISFLAKSNARYGRPMREDEVNPTIPYFEVYKNSLNRYDVRSYAYEGHDNAPRMEFWCDYLQRNIFPNIDPNVDISGFYNIELHDSYTYLDRPRDIYKNVLTFSRFKNDNGPILIPDPYMMSSYGESLEAAAAADGRLEWKNKQSKVCFFGTTTGNRDPIKNTRIDLCLWGLQNKDICDFAITNIAQMSEEDVRFKLPNFNSIYRPVVSLEEQLSYKYHLVPDGNTCKFDVWNNVTSNVVMRYESKEMLWYYPLLQEDIHYVSVNKQNLRHKVQMLEANPQIAQIMIYNARKTAQGLFRPIIPQMYTISLLEAMAENRA